MAALGRNRFIWILGFLALTLAVVYAAFGYLYSSFRRRLDEELGARLVGVATATAAAVNGPLWDRLRLGDAAALREVSEELGAVRAMNDLSTIFLFDVDERTLLDLRGQYPVGQPNPALRYDLIAATSALAGIPAFTRLYEGEGAMLKTGYAPVFAADGEVLGGVGVEASAGFFAVLDGVRRTIFAAGAATLVAIVLLGAGFARVEVVQSRLETRLRRAETLATMGQMTAMLAHEIRNPLGIIRGAAETLAERYGLKDEEVYRFIPEEVDRLHRTVSAYLDFARGEGGEETADLAGALARSLDLVEGEMERRGIAVERTLPEGPVAVRSGEDRLRQAFLNLLLNARDAMPEGGTLRVRVDAEPREVTVAVADTGAGMSEEVRRRAVEPFFTSREKGSGLGLAIVDRVVTDAGGRLAIESRPGAGTTITMKLPRVAEGEANG